MSNGGQRAFDAEIEAVREQVATRWLEWQQMTSPEEMRAMELEAAELGRRVADAITEDVLRGRVSEPSLVATAVAAALSGETPMRRSGSAKVPITLLGGRRIEIKVPYLRPDHRGRPGPKRKPGQHGKAGVGMHQCYPPVTAFAKHPSRDRNTVTCRRSTGRATAPPPATSIRT
jgi:hypothetical protein